MFLTVIVLAPPGEGSGVGDPEVIRTALCRHLDVAGPVEHIRVRAIRDEVHIGILSLAATQAEADAAASALCRDTVAGEPALHGWRLRPATAEERP